MAKAMYVGAKPVLPNGYTAVEYIESTGEQYINTGYVPNTNTRVVMEGVFTAPTSAENYDFVAFGVDSSTYDRFEFAYNSDMSILRTDNSSRGFNDIIVCDGEKHIIDCSPSSLTIDGINYFKETQSSRPTYDLFIFASNMAGTPYFHAKMKLYSCKIYEGNTLVRDYVPAVNALKMKGLYDLVNKTFRMTLSDTNFLAGGEAISVARKVIQPYIGVDGVARKVVRAYVGDANGKARLFYDSYVTVTIRGHDYSANDEGTEAKVTINGTTYYFAVGNLSGAVIIHVPVGTVATFTLESDGFGRNDVYLNGEVIAEGTYNSKPTVYNYTITSNIKVDLHYRHSVGDMDGVNYRWGEAYITTS